jgi:hypothetical protein
VCKKYWNKKEWEILESWVGNLTTHLMSPFIKISTTVLRYIYMCVYVFSVPSCYKKKRTWAFHSYNSIWLNYDTRKRWNMSWFQNDIYAEVSLLCTKTFVYVCGMKNTSSVSRWMRYFLINYFALYVNSIKLWVY